jgi:thiol-disulfide isomerase/thioredoxin
MKLKPLFILLTSLIISSCTTNKKTPPNFTLNGTIGEDYEGYIYLKYNDIIDSTLVVDSKFYFEGNVDHPVEAFLKQKPDDVGAPFYFAQENIDLTITRKNNRFYLTEISGSKTMLLIESVLEDIGTILEEELNPNEKLYAALKNLIQENPDNPFVGELFVELVTDAHRITLDQSNELYSMLQPTALDASDKQSFELAINRMKNLNIGDSMIDFKFQTIINTEVNNETYRGKYLLVDFWASWCGPCIAALPRLKALHSAYNTKSFDILSISLDESEEVWKKTLNKHQLPWSQSIDTNGWDSELAQELGVVFLPFNYLIDPNGKIVAINIDVEKLEKELPKLLTP